MREIDRRDSQVRYLLSLGYEDGDSVPGPGGLGGGPSNHINKGDGYCHCCFVKWPCPQVREVRHTRYMNSLGPDEMPTIGPDESCWWCHGVNHKGVIRRVQYIEDVARAANIYRLSKAEQAAVSWGRSGVPHVDESKLPPCPHRADGASR
jgi:hypothetical protein